MTINQNDIITAGYIFLIFGGLIVLWGALIVYNIKKSKRRK